MYTCIIPSAITTVYDYCRTILTDEEQSHLYYATILAFIVFIYLVCFLPLVLFFASFFPSCASNIKPLSRHLSFLGIGIVGIL